jgi:hypothetical protein
MITEHTRELIDLAVMLHIRAGGSEAEKLRELLIGSHEIAYMDGLLEVINGIDAWVRTHAAIKMAARSVPGTAQ